MASVVFVMSALVCVGWEEGVGLGLREQGIQEPIRGGEVRDKNDKYKVSTALQAPDIETRLGDL